MPGELQRAGELVDLFGAEFSAEYDELFEGDDFGADQFGGRRSRRKARRAKRRTRRRRIFKKVGKGLKKVANNKVVRGISKAVLSVVPGGSTIGMAAGMAEKAVKGVVRLAKSKRDTGAGQAAQAALKLAARARKGDRSALATLKIGATGTKNMLPDPDEVLAKRAASRRVRRGQKSNQTPRQRRTRRTTTGVTKRSAPTRALPASTTTRRTPRAKLAPGQVLVELGSGKSFRFRRDDL